MLKAFCTFETKKNFSLLIPLTLGVGDPCDVGHLDPKREHRYHHEVQGGQAGEN